MLPTFLILGAPRSATTSLHYYLAQHPDVTMSATKEPNYFLFDHRGGRAEPLIADRRIIVKSVSDRAQYERLFTQPGSAVGEASPLYLYTEQTPRLIAETIPAARLIAIVREPVARAYSHFVYVNERLGEQASAAFAQAAMVELPLPDSPYLGGTHSLRLGRYAPQLQRYLACFEPSQLLVLGFDDVQHRPDQALERVCRFLGVDPSYRFETGRHYAPSATAATGALDRLLKPARPYLKRLLPARVGGALARRRAGRQADAAAPSAVVPEATRALLADYYAESNAWLREEFGIDLT